MLAKTELDAVHTCLRDAADLIEKDGWWAGPTREPSRDRRQCAAMAIQMVTDNNQVSADAFGILAKHVGIKYSHIPTWNDASTEEIVVQALRDAAYGVK